MLRHKASHSSTEIAHLLHKARAIHVEGELARAEKLYKVILEREPDNFDAAHLLEVLNYQRDRPTEALRDLAAAVKRDMRSAEALSNYGLALHSLGQIEDALASYVAALGIEPDNVDLLTNVTSRFSSSPGRRRIKAFHSATLTQILLTSRRLAIAAIPFSSSITWTKRSLATTRCAR